jgi:Holliday junction resolvase
MTEQQIQRQLVKKLESEGYYVIKLTVTNKTGIPDLIALKPNEVRFIEVKRPKGIISKIQEFRIKELRKLGFNAEVYRGES